MSVTAKQLERRPATPRDEQAAAHSPIRKSSAMIIFILAAYAASGYRFMPRLLGLYGESSSWGGDVVLTIFLFQLQVFALYGCFFIGQALFSFGDWLRPKKGLPPLRTSPKVAILYTTLHDFQEDAVLTCLRQDYPHAKTFILDDSKRDDAIAAVDQFAARNPEVTVIRRADRKGFKAGNINNALTNHIHGFDYFAIADADSLLPSNFVSSLLPYFGTDENLAFLQARFVPAPDPKTRFAADMELQIHAMWGVYCRARNRYGSVIFLGHGGMLRYEVWRKIGGFPEIISEDLGFSHRAARIGYRGMYVLDVASAEEFPDEYAPFRKQQKRYVQGITQYLHREYGAYFRSPHVRWFEKLDTLLTCGSLLMPAFFLAFMLLYCLLMPIFFGVSNVLAVEFGDREFSFPVRLLSQQFYDIAFTPDYFVWTIICTLSPLIGSVPVMLHHPCRGLRMLILAAGPYMSLMIAATASIASYLTFRTAVFTATGDRKQPQAAPTADRWWSRMFSTSVLEGLFEIALGAYLLMACFLTLNPVLPAFAVGICIAPLLSWGQWNAWWLRPFLYLPLCFLAIGLTWSIATIFVR